MLTTFLLLASIAQTAPLSRALVGTWTGTLEYRDYRSDRRVILPTRLIITAAANGTLEYAYVYDDGPGKVVTSSERVNIDAAAATYRVQNDEGYDATFAMAGAGESGSQSNSVVLTGKGSENAAVVDLRITITVTSAGLVMLRESRRAGEDWLFRNRYALTR